MALEQEIKLVINHDSKLDLSTVSCLSSLEKEPAEISHLVSTYFDTADLDLSKQRVGLRMRQYDEAWWQTVKTAGKVENGLHQRDEWEHPLDNPEWDLNLLRQTPLASLINDAKKWASLSPLFTTDFIRESIQLTLDDSTQIELAYDRGQVTAGDCTGSIHEIELELKSGKVESMALLAEVLCQELDLRPSDCSKAKQGYQLAEKNRLAS